MRIGDGDERTLVAIASLVISLRKEDSYCHSPDAQFLEKDAR